MDIIKTNPRRLHSVRFLARADQLDWLARQPNKDTAIRQALDLLIAIETQQNESTTEWKCFVCGGCGHSVETTIDKDNRTFVCPDCGYTSQIGTH